MSVLVVSKWKKDSSYYLQLMDNDNYAPLDEDNANLHDLHALFYNQNKGAIQNLLLDNVLNEISRVYPQVSVEQCDDDNDIGYNLIECSPMIISDIIRMINKFSLQLFGEPKEVRMLYICQKTATECELIISEGDNALDRVYTIMRDITNKPFIIDRFLVLLKENRIGYTQINSHNWEIECSNPDILKVIIDPLF